MTPKPAPRLATWLLTLLLPDSEHDSMVGDLMEQYQRGRSSFWYSKQVLGMLFSGRRAAWRRLSPGRTTLSCAVGILVAVPVVASVLLSNIAPLLSVGVFGGIVVAGLMQYLYNRSGPDVRDIRVARIDSSRISVGGGVGSGILIVVLLAGVWIDLPSLRLMAAPGLLAGVIFATVLQLWRHAHPPRPRVVPLRLGDHH